MVDLVIQTAKGLLSHVDDKDKIAELTKKQIELENSLTTNATDGIKNDQDRNTILSKRLAILDQIIKKQTDDDVFKTLQANRQAAAQNAADAITGAAKDASIGIESLGGVDQSTQLIQTLAEVQNKRNQIANEVDRQNTLDTNSRALIQGQIADLAREAVAHGNILSTVSTIGSLMEELVANDGKSALFVQQKNQELADQDRILTQLRVSALNAADALARQIAVTQQSLDATSKVNALNAQLESIRSAFGSIGGDDQQITAIVSSQNEQAKLNLEIRQGTELLERSALAYANQLAYLGAIQAPQEQIDAFVADQTEQLQAQNQGLQEKTLQLQAQVTAMKNLKDAAVEETNRLNNETSLKLIQDNTQAAIDGARHASDETKAYIASNGQLSLMREQLTQTVKQVEDQSDAGLAYVDSLRKIGASQDVINAAIDLENARRAQGLELIDQQSEAIQNQAKINEENRIKASNSTADIGAQAQLIIQGKLDALPDQYQQILTSISAAIEGFSSAISDSIVEAFDPSNAETALQRFADFFRDLAKTIIQQLVQIAVVKTIAFAFGANTGGQVPVGTGKAAGGPVAQGFAAGGAPMKRPRGLHPSDTIPIWAAPGEWVIRAKSAMMYGRQVMGAINEGLIDPLVLKGLAGVKRGSAMGASASGLGFAAGGDVLSQILRSNADARQAQTQQQAPKVYVVPTLTADNTTLARILAGGDTALYEHLASDPKYKALFAR